MSRHQKSLVLGSSPALNSGVTLAVAVHLPGLLGSVDKAGCGLHPSEGLFQSRVPVKEEQGDVKSVSEKEQSDFHRSLNPEVARLDQKGRQAASMSASSSPSVFVF